jgi:hypothetical protein
VGVPREVARPAAATADSTGMMRTATYFHTWKRLAY